eukprot:1072385-Pyramimonas_sp.AAC.1
MTLPRMTPTYGADQPHFAPACQTAAPPLVKPSYLSREPPYDPFSWLLLVTPFAIPSLRERDVASDVAQASHIMCQLEEVRRALATAGQQWSSATQQV